MPRFSGRCCRRDCRNHWNKDDLMEITLTRHKSTPQGTTGQLTMDGFSAYTIELPWRDNQRSISCIPAGRYPCARVVSPRFGRTFEICNVPRRSAILFHSGNFAGDHSIGYRTDSHGCVLIGSHLGTLDHQLAVLSSRPAVRRFLEAVGDVDEFVLIVEGGNA